MYTLAVLMLRNRHLMVEAEGGAGRIVRWAIVIRVLLFFWLLVVV